jgi:hypothetical protein
MIKILGGMKIIHHIGEMGLLDRLIWKKLEIMRILDFLLLWSLHICKKSKLIHT